MRDALSIVGEVKLRVRQNLLTRAAATWTAVKRLYSHAQSFAQCIGWLARHLPSVPRIVVASNAEAARLAVAEPGAGAIAGEIAGRTYGVPGARRRTSRTSPTTRTRFWVIGRQQVGALRPRRDLARDVGTQPSGRGAHLLEPLARHGVSMTRFESRPARTGRWEYLFFVDLTGHRDDAPVAAALAELAERAPFLKLLGSYPAAPDL